MTSKNAPRVWLVLSPCVNAWAKLTTAVLDDLGVDTLQFFIAARTCRCGKRTGESARKPDGHVAVFTVGGEIYQETAHRWEREVEPVRRRRGWVAFSVDASVAMVALCSPAWFACPVSGKRHVARIEPAGGQSYRAIPLC